jgi:hypothetical protein
MAVWKCPYHYPSIQASFLLGSYLIVNREVILDD